MGGDGGNIFLDGFSTARIEEKMDGRYKHI